MKRRVLLIAFGVSSCLLPRVDFDSSLGSAGTSAGGGSGEAPFGGTDAGGSAGPGGGRKGSAGAPSGQGGKSGAGSGGQTTGSARAPSGSAGASSGQGGKAGVGSGGASSGGALGSAGSSSTAGRGSGGTSGSGGAGAGGASVGGCGSLAVSQSDAKCCVASAPTTNVSSSLAIDDLEDDDSVILPLGNRQGYWFTYSDSNTTLMPSGGLTPTAGGHACSLLPVPPACAGKAGGIAYSAAISGLVSIATVTTPSYAGLGFDFNNHLTKSCAYGGSVYQGISFWAKGNVALRAVIKIPATTSTSTTASVGTCTANCEDHYGISVPVLDPATWKQFTITFSDSVNFAQVGWGTPVAFDPSVLLAMQFQFSGSIAATTTTPYSFSIDDVAFFTQ